MTRATYRPVLMCLFLTAFPPSSASEEPSLSRIAFGSCAHQDSTQRIWESILSLKPQLFVLLGDNLYADAMDVETLRAAYSKFGEVP